LLALLVLDAFFGLAHFSEHGGWTHFREGPLWQLALSVLVVAPVQAYSLARIGIYEGLAQTTSLRASFMTAWNAGLLPWISWIAVLLGLETSQQYLRIPARLTDDLAFGAWASVQLLVCLLCLTYASCRLRWRFRSLAAQTIGTRWWKRWFPRRG
jgi:hypothetical protein